MDATLNERLAAFAEWHRELDPELAAAHDRLIKRLTSAGCGQAAPAVGQPMPSFALPDHEGRLATLEKILQSGPAVISFNCGQWCPYCKLEVVSLAQKQAELTQLGAHTVSIVPDRQAYARKFREVSNLPFSVLSDLHHGYAVTLGLMISVGKEIRSLYINQSIDLSRYQGNDAGFLAMPATFVLGQDGLIKAQFVDPDFRRRMEFDQILAALRAPVD